jgi:lipopolysaccharide transport protein LptA
MNNFTRIFPKISFIIPVILIFFVTLVFSAASFAASGNLMVTRTIANLREKPNYDSSVSWILSAGKVFKVGKAKKGWYSVYPAVAKAKSVPVGFISEKVASTAPKSAETVDWGDVRYIGRKIKYFAQRSQKSKVVGQLKQGDEIKVGFLRDGWYAVFKSEQKVEAEDNALGFIKSSDVDLDNSDSTIRYAVRKVSVIAKPSAGAKAVGVLFPGYRVQVGEEHDGMFAVYRIDTPVQKNTPVWGYVWGPFLAQYPSSIENKKLSGMTIASVKKDKSAAVKAKDILPTKKMYPSTVLNLRSEPDVNSLIVGKLEKGETVMVGQAEGKWYPVYKSGTAVHNKSQAIGYVYGTYLKADVPEQIKSDDSAKKQKTSPKDQVPIKIVSTKMTFSEVKNQVTFLGNVKVTRLDITLTSDSLTAFLRQGSESLKDASNKIKKIVAYGNVDVVMGNRKGTCDKLTFLVDDSIIIMDGKARLADGKNIVQGKTIKFYLKDSRSEVIGGDKPVEAIFFTPKDVSP